MDILEVSPVPLQDDNHSQGAFAERFYEGCGKALAKELGFAQYGVRSGSGN